MMSCVNGDFDFHPINLYRPRDTSSLVRGFREGLKDGFSSFITEALTGSLSEIIRGHASDFLKADPKSAYYEYFKKIEKFMKKDGVEELTDEMVKAISELAIIKGSSCMTVGGFPLHKFAWPLFYGLLSRSSGPRNFD